MKERTCISCDKKTAGKNLLKWVNWNGKIIPDWLSKLKTRAVYTHYNRKCIGSFYSKKRLNLKFYNGKTDFFYPKDKIGAHIKEQALKSLAHFLSLAKKSGVVLRGQNLILSKIYEGVDIGYCFYAQDTSSNTVNTMKKSIDSIREIPFTKQDLAGFFDGRDTAVVALISSEVSEKVLFYMNVFENFTSGDIDENK